MKAATTPNAGARSTDHAASEASAQQKIREFKTSRERREYLRRYYQTHREKSLQYQREYNLRHKKKAISAGLRPSNGRVTVRTSLHAGDIMHATPDRAARLIDQIVRGDRCFVASTTGLSSPSRQE